MTKFFSIEKILHLNAKGMEWEPIVIYEEPHPREYALEFSAINLATGEKYLQGEEFIVALGKSAPDNSEPDRCFGTEVAARITCGGCITVLSRGFDTFSDEEEEYEVLDRLMVEDLDSAILQQQKHRYYSLAWGKEGSVIQLLSFSSVLTLFFLSAILDLKGSGINV